MRRDLRQLRRRTEPGHLRGTPYDATGVRCTPQPRRQPAPRPARGARIDRRLLQRFQAALEWVMYDPSPEAENIRRRCFVPKGELGLQTWPTGRPMTTKREDGLSHATTFLPQLHCASRRRGDREETLTTVRTIFEEQELIRCTYTDEALYSGVGKPLWRVLDVALAKGGPETVMEALYRRHGRPAQGRMPVKRYAGQPHQSRLVGLLSSVVAVPELIGRSTERHLETEVAPAYYDV